MSAVVLPRPVIGSSRKNSASAGDRVEDAGDLGDRRDEPAPPVGEQREREGDREADRRPTTTIRYDVLPEAGRRSGRSCRRSSPGRSRCLRRTLSLAAPRSRMKPPSLGEARHALTRRRVLVASSGSADDARPRAARHAPSPSTTRRTRPAASRSPARRAARRRSAPAARRLALAARVPGHRPAVVDRVTRSRRGAAVVERSPAVDVARDALSARRLSARSAPTKSSTNSSAGLHQQLRRRRVLGQHAARLAAPRCGRPS